MAAADNPDQKPERINRRRLVLNLLGTPLFFALFLFLPAGDDEQEERHRRHHFDHREAAALPAPIVSWCVHSAS